MWRIYYADGSVVRGSSAADWLSAPDTGVQVVVLMESPAMPRWTCEGVVVRDRQLWTGEDEYDPFGWGAKRGSWLPDDEYHEIWRRACSD